MYLKTPFVLHMLQTYKANDMVILSYIFRIIYVKVSTGLENIIVEELTKTCFGAVTRTRDTFNKKQY